MFRAAFIAALACLIGHAALAHAYPQRTIPRIDSKLPTSPPAVTIIFTEQVEPSLSAIEVRNANGDRIDKADLHPTGDSGRQLTTDLPKLQAGQYTVIWHATSVDTHKTDGRFSFSVLP